MVEDSIAKNVIFSWEGNVIDGKPYPAKNFRMGHGLKANRKAGPVRNMKNWYANTEIYGLGHQSRKKFRRAVRLARGLMDNKRLGELFKRVIS